MVLNKWAISSTGFQDSHQRQCTLALSAQYRSTYWKSTSSRFYPCTHATLRITYLNICSGNEVVFIQCTMIHGLSQQNVETRELQYVFFASMSVLGTCEACWMHLTVTINPQWCQYMMQGLKLCLVADIVAQMLRISTNERRKRWITLEPNTSNSFTGGMKTY